MVATWDIINLGQLGVLPREKSTTGDSPIAVTPTSPRGSNTLEPKQAESLNVSLRRTGWMKYGKIRLGHNNQKS